MEQPSLFPTLDHESFQPKPSPKNEKESQPSTKNKEAIDEICKTPVYRKLYH